MISLKKSILYLLSFIFCLLSFFLTACSTSTDGNDNQVVFSGTVTLQDTTDYSGVAVSLYKPVDLDTALLHINQEYPTIGVQISQETQFDHHDYEPLTTTMTKADGSWEMEVEEGTYNIVAEKDGYGWKYLYDAAKNNTIELTKIINLSGTYTSSMDIAAGSFVEITADVDFPVNTTLTINTPATLLFKNNSTLRIEGQLNILNSAFVYVFNDDNNNAINFRFSDNNNSISMNNIIFYNSESPVYISGSKNVLLNNMIFSGNSIGIDLFNNESISVQNCIFNNCNTGINSENTKTNFSKNIVLQSDKAGYTSWNDHNSEITLNLFEKCTTAIDINNGLRPDNSTLQITQNDFKNNNIHISIYQRGFVTGNYNNFLESESYAVKTTFITNDSLDFTLNFWNVFNNFEIEQRIYDFNKNDIYAIIDYSGFLTEKVIWP